jgi:class 3 adenylate cyclase
MGGKIKLEAPGSDAAVFELGNTTGIGRAAGNQIRLEADAAASRQHAMIRLQGEQEYYLVDLGSANGTFLNDKLVVAPALLRHGDRIKVGETEMLFDLPGPSPDEQRHITGLHLEKTQVAVHLRTMVVLVGDIRHFTRIGEFLPPDRLARFLGSWFCQAAEIITSHKGVVDKFIGDAVMAYWILDERAPTAAAESAVDAARALHRQAASIQVPDHPEFAFRIGVGINQGLVSSGTVGVNQRDSTIMGDAVTLAFRLESVCKVKKVPIVVGADLVRGMGDKYPFVSLGKVQLKGKAVSPEAFSLQVE